ncbi:phosphoenolpyruvate synthase [Leptothoe sp. PORK10 BA2]|uniref:phosphoenolpyruvate synthase n=1 Tax=Leptothoe sp. PORK10 BA2 TaxID=3110254 RepID=UPI002B221073|nr:phosphoenolpyruvate synthase [Leptothoe sp. PORK10 BA2]MEA5463935.1 phosphoenolpyruvate synthase [Leptothoe sp. PORK10 BA2]
MLQNKTAPALGTPQPIENPNLERSVTSPFLLPFEALGIHDIPCVGGKNASLGEMIQQLSRQGVKVPTGFATTADAYRYFIHQAGLDAKLRKIFLDLDVEDVANLRERGKLARTLILETPFPEELSAAIALGYQQLCDRYQTPNVDVAVRSSATAEDLPDASFAGQQETYLNVHGVKGVVDACHRCFASLFTDRAISYRTINGFDHFEVALSVGVQKMVRSDLATSGVMFSIDTETGFKNAVLITAAYGLGENVVQGVVNPDEYVVFKPTLSQGCRPILRKQLGSKAIKMVYDVGGGKLTKNLSVPVPEQKIFALSDDDVLTLARWACIIEAHYSAVRGMPTPMDMEWGKDGMTGELFILQARPETVQSQNTGSTLRNYRLTMTPAARPGPAVTGRAVGALIGQGRARVISDATSMAEFQAGEVLVTERTDPDWEPIMKRASAIVTNQGGRTCHAAIIAREMGIPAVVGCGDATAKLATGQLVTVSCAEGEEGLVYPALLDFEIEETKLGELPPTQTQILMNVGNPAEAFGLAAIPCDGVGLARLEFIIANQIKVHPLALLRYDELEDGEEKRAIAAQTALYPNKPDFFVDQLAQGMATIAAAFYPKPVVVRLSDFKSNEYANLLGGRQFEPQEENPMIGWRGASRYYGPSYRAAFGLECKALKQVRETMGLTNVIPMIPFCRTPQEGEKVLAEMAQHGLVRGEHGLQVYVMCEIPSNVILADQFCDIFDGFSIGSNDLTQLTLGLDRDSALVADLFDERNGAVKALIAQVIATAKRRDRKIGICGQAPSDYPEFSRFLVEQGINSISLNPDSLLQTRIAVAELEQSGR